MNKPAFRFVCGANVMYCGHAGYFIADLYFIGDACTVFASAPVDTSKLHRHNELGQPTHVMVDFPVGGLWCPGRGVFSVPASQVRVWERGEAA